MFHWVPRRIATHTRREEQQSKAEKTEGRITPIVLWSPSVPH